MANRMTVVSGAGIDRAVIRRAVTLGIDPRNAATADIVDPKQLASALGQMQDRFPIVNAEVGATVTLNPGRHHKYGNTARLLPMTSGDMIEYKTDGIALPCTAGGLGLQ